MKKAHLNPPTLFDSARYGFSQVVVAEAAKHVFISGQVALDKNMNIVGANNLKEQTVKALDNVRLAVEAADGTMSDIVSIRLYIVNFKSKDSKTISESLKNAFGSENLPASTWISVNGLANESFMIEIEAQAVL